MYPIHRSGIPVEIFTQMCRELQEELVKKFRDTCRPIIPGFDVACLYDDAEKETSYAKRLKALAINLIRLEVYTVTKCLDKRGRYMKQRIPLKHMRKPSPLLSKIYLSRRFAMQKPRSSRTSIISS